MSIARNDLDAAIQKFERLEADISPRLLQEWATRFCEKNFINQMQNILFTAAGTSVAPLQ